MSKIHPVTKKKLGRDILFKRKSEDLLRIARSIFGEGLVSSVSVVTWSYENSEIHEYETEPVRIVKHRLSDSLERIKSSSRNREYKSLHYDAGTIWIEFVNGRVVEFSASEWAWLSVAKTEISRDA